MMKKICVFMALAFLSCIGLKAEAKQHDIVVAQDGSGNFRSVQQAINAVADNNPKRTVIFVKKGIYHEHVEVPAAKINLSIIGEDAEKTVITDTLCVKSIDPSTGKEYGRDRTTSFVIYASGFYAENISFENDSRVKAQALAVTVEGEWARFKNCRLLGFQDTLYLCGQSFFENCFISGTTDFIFGPATAVFYACTLHSRRGNYLTASSAPQTSKFGFVFLNCKLTSESNVLAYLGRPWGEYANVVFINCEMGAHIRPEGWDNWRKPKREKTARYAEYHSTGPGANPVARVKWSRQLTDEEAKEYTIENIFSIYTK